MTIQRMLKATGTYRLRLLPTILLIWHISNPLSNAR